MSCNGDIIYSANMCEKYNNHNYSIEDRQLVKADQQPSTSSGYSENYRQNSWRLRRPSSSHQFPGKANSTAVATEISNLNNRRNYWRYVLCEQRSGHKTRRRRTDCYLSSCINFLFFLLVFSIAAINSSHSVIHEYSKDRTKSPLIIHHHHSSRKPASREIDDPAVLASSNGPVDFERWINSTQNDIFLNRSSYSEGEVLPFRTKKSRHRAIAVMNVASFSSKFSDALTFKEWLRSVYYQDKALKVTVQTTEIVRPVLQHLYATQGGFRAPIIIHANVFGTGTRQGTGRAHLSNGMSTANEKPVDAVTFIHTVSELLPDAVISLGWIQSSDYVSVNRLDWSQAFRLANYLHGVRQPIILNMKLNDAIHSMEPLEWLLGIADAPFIYAVLRGEITDFVDSDAPLQRLAEIGAAAAGGATRRKKILFDVDDGWRKRISRSLPRMIDEETAKRKKRRSVEPERWRNFEWANPHQMLSTSVVSAGGVAFLGWPNSLLVSTQRPRAYAATRQQRVSGRVMFLTKRQARDVALQRNSGMVIHLFEGGDADDFTEDAPELRNSIRIFIGYDGRMLVENNRRDISGFDGLNVAEDEREEDRHYYHYNTQYQESSVGQLPRWPCYGFEVIDRGWRVELDAWTERCHHRRSSNDVENGDEIYRMLDGHDGGSDPFLIGGSTYRVYLQLDTPMTRTRKTRHVAVGKSGDGAVDFLLREIDHNNSAHRSPMLVKVPIMAVAALLIGQRLVWWPRSINSL